MLPESKDMMKEIDKGMKVFHTYWLKNGKPHPSSNAYLSMTRMIWYKMAYEKGFKDGMKAEKKYGH